MEYSILDEGRTNSVSEEAVSVASADRLLMSQEALRSCLGWELKPEGFCREGICVPVRDRDSVLRPSGEVDLSAFSELIDRPIVMDSEQRVVALGTASSSRAASMASLKAPDFELPDLDGQMHSLSDFHGKKVLLIAYASW